MPDLDPRDPVAPRRPTRRDFLRAAAGTTGLFLVSACGGASQSAKPTEATKPPAKAAGATSSASPPASPASSPAAQAVPAVPAGLPNLKGTSLSVLQWQSFVPEADPFFRKQIEEGFVKETGAQVSIEFVNANDLQPKIAAAIQSGAGPDIIQLQYNWPHIYQEGLVELTDLAEDIKKQTGDFYPQLEAATKVGGKYFGVPHDHVGNAMHWRKEWFAEAGSPSFPATFDEYHELGGKLKAQGRPFGQALSHSFGDPPTWCYPMMWAYGGQERDQSRKVVINSPETIAAVTAMKNAWQTAYDETGLAWDDGANNRAFLAGTVSSVLNGASIWWVARQQGSPFFDDIGLDLLPAGPKGRYLFVLNNEYAVMGYSKSQDAARAFIRWSMQPSVWMPWFEVGQSYYAGVGPAQDAAAPWEKFPSVTHVFKEAGPITRYPGYAGPYDQQAGLAQSKYIIVDMFARAVQGEAPGAAVAWAENELKQVYT